MARTVNDASVSDADNRRLSVENVRVVPAEQQTPTSSRSCEKWRAIGCHRRNSQSSSAGCCLFRDATSRAAVSATSPPFCGVQKYVSHRCKHRAVSIHMRSCWLLVARGKNHLCLPAHHPEAQSASRGAAAAGRAAASRASSAASSAGSAGWAAIASAGNGTAGAAARRTTASSRRDRSNAAP